MNKKNKKTPSAKQLATKAEKKNVSIHDITNKVVDIIKKPFSGKTKEQQKKPFGGKGGRKPKPTASERM